MPRHRRDRTGTGAAKLPARFVAGRRWGRLLNAVGDDIGGRPAPARRERPFAPVPAQNFEAHVGAGAAARGAMHRQAEPRPAAIEFDRLPAADIVAEDFGQAAAPRSEEHTSELQSLMRISYAVFCLKKKKTTEHI